uniref:Putative evasin n=1 Tax=Ixodes ricinus TaxID=34613 RepID=A0A6B0UTT5_IXORI
MLWLKLMLVILISEIGERAMCSGSGPVPSVKESEKTPYSLPQESLINDTSDGCNRQLLPYLDENGMGVLTVNCTKYCTGDKQATDVNGNPCITVLQATSKTGTRCTNSRKRMSSPSGYSPHQGRGKARMVEWVACLSTRQA